MLAKSARLTESGDFARATKSGLRFSTPNFIGYLYATNLPLPARAGLIITKNIGSSVNRHLIARQIRHTIHDNYTQLSNGTLFVVRALNGAHNGDAANEIPKIIVELTKKLAKQVEQK